MKCLLQEMGVLNKRVIVRCDFNVPVKDGKILDDTKIKASLETINYLIDKNCKIILLSHFDSNGGQVRLSSDVICQRCGSGAFPMESVFLRENP